MALDNLDTQLKEFLLFTEDDIKDMEKFESLLYGINDRLKELADREATDKALTKKMIEVTDLQEEEKKTCFLCEFDDVYQHMNYRHYMFGGQWYTICEACIGLRVQSSIKEKLQ